MNPDKSSSGTVRLGIVRKVFNSKNQPVEQINHDSRNGEWDPHFPNRPVSEYDTREKAGGDESTHDISNEWLCVSYVLIGGHTTLFQSSGQKHSCHSRREIVDGGRSLHTETDRAQVDPRVAGLLVVALGLVLTGVITVGTIVP